MAHEAATRALIGIRDGSDLESSDFHDLVQAISQYLFRVWPGLTQAEAQDAASATVERLLTRREFLAELPEDRLLGYALRGARNFQIDRWRAQKREIPLDLPDSAEFDLVQMVSDDDIIRLLERTASLQIIKKVLRELLDDGDLGAYRALISWLDLAYQWGTSPTNRDVANVLGISHTSVSRAMLRAKRRLDSSSDEVDS